MRSGRGAHCGLLLACVLGACGSAQAAGGQFAVDDASILDPGTCQVEVWIDRAGAGRGTLLHAGPGCRLGPVELSLNVERFHADGSGTVSSIGPQLKWVHALAPSLSAGIVVSTAVRDRSPRVVGTGILLPLTWEASDSLRFHLNAGRDFVHDGADRARSGVALEWQPSASWSLGAERFREVGLDFWRAGIRWMPQANLSVDVSHAEGLAGAPARWGLGLNLVFDR